jgi:hypothetical protein
MKYIFSVLVATVAMSAFAQERVELNRGRIFINSHEAVIARTVDTPSKIEVEMMVPMSEPVCERREYRQVLRTSTIHCGSVVERRVTYDRVCVARHTNGTCRTYRRQERVTNVSRPRTCYVSESYCAAYGTITDYEKDSVKLEFKKASNLSEGQEETFLIRANQKRSGSSSVEYTIEVLEAQRDYSIKQGGIFKRGTYTITGK